MLVAANIFAFLTVIYGGFAMNYVNGIPLWNTALLPILYVISGLWGGAEVTLGIALASGEMGVGMAIEEWIRILLIGFILLIPVYLMSVRYTSLTGAGLGKVHGAEQMVTSLLDCSGHPGDGHTVDRGNQ